MSDEPKLKVTLTFNPVKAVNPLQLQKAYEIAHEQIMRELKSAWLQDMKEEFNTGEYTIIVEDVG